MKALADRIKNLADDLLYGKGTPRNLIAVSLLSIESDLRSSCDKIGDQTAMFLVWWKGDNQRCLCTLEQAIGAYISTYPGRLHFLLVELLEHLR